MPVEPRLGRLRRDRRSEGVVEEAGAQRLPLVGRHGREQARSEGHPDGGRHGARVRSRVTAPGLVPQGVAESDELAPLQLQVGLRGARGER